MLDFDFYYYNYNRKMKKYDFQTRLGINQDTLIYKTFDISYRLLFIFLGLYSIIM